MQTTFHFCRPATLQLISHLALLPKRRHYLMILDDAQRAPRRLALLMAGDATCRHFGAAVTIYADESVMRRFEPATMPPASLHLPAY